MAITTRFVSITMAPSGAELASDMEHWASRVDDWSETWPHVTRLLRNHNRRTFDSEGEKTGDQRRWAPLTPAYAARKAREFPGRRILERTGALRRAMVDGGSGSRVRSTKKSYESSLTGKVAKYGGYHQTGTPRMVARPPVKYDRDPRNSKGLTWTLGQMLQATVVAHRRGAFASVGDKAKLQGTLRRLSERTTR